MEKLYLNTKSFDSALVKEEINRAGFCKIANFNYDRLNKLLANKTPIKNDEVVLMASLLYLPEKDLITRIPIDYKNYVSPFAQHKSKSSSNEAATSAYGDKKKYLGTLNFDVLDKRLEEMGSCFNKMKDILSFSSSYKPKWKAGTPVSVKIGTKICKYTGLSKKELFTPYENFVTPTVAEKKTEQTENKTTKEAIKPEEKKSPEYAYKQFSGTIIMDNIAVLNENILTLAKELGDTRKKIDAIEKAFDNERRDSKEKFSEIEKGFSAILQKLNNTSVAENKTDTRPKACVPSKKKTVTYWSSISEDPKKCATSYDENDSLNVYKIKLSNMVKFVAKKESKIFTQVCVDINREFESTYGVNIVEEKKVYADSIGIDEYKTIPVFEVIYHNPVYRNVYFNLIASKVLQY